MTCYHTRKKLESEGDSWRYTCHACGHSWTEQKRKTFEVPAYMGAAKAHDPNDLTGQGIHLRDPRRRGSAYAHEKAHRKHVERLRETAPKRRGKHGMRVVASMPVELYHGKLKQDKRYWDDPNNVRRHKEFLVDP